MKNNRNDAPLLVIDESCVGYKQWHKMASANYEPETSKEDMEFAINMYLFHLFLQEAFQPHETIFAMDSRPNWRVQVYKDYYLDHMKLFQKITIVMEDTPDPDVQRKRRKFEKEYIAQFDQKTIKYFYSDDAQKWMKRKMIKVDIAKIDWEEYTPVKCTNKQLKIELGIEPSVKMGDVLIDKKMKDRIEKLHRIKKEKILYETLKGLSPEYKGNRMSTSGWDYATPKNGFMDENNNFVPGFRELLEGLANSLAGTFGAKVIKAKDAEADDVIAHYVKNDKSGRDIILVSVDSDLHQLFLDSIFFKFYNPNVDEDGNLSHFGGFIDLNATTVKFKLRQKLLSGDSSDNIPAVGQYDEKLLMKGEKVLKSTLVGEKTAEKWLTEKKLKDILPLLDPKSFERNRKLIHLDNIPKQVNKNIAKAFKEATIPEFVDEKEYGASSLKILITRQAALFRKGDNDEAEGLDSEIDKLSPPKKTEVLGD